MAVEEKEGIGMIDPDQEIEEREEEKGQDHDLEIEASGNEVSDQDQGTKNGVALDLEKRRKAEEDLDHALEIEETEEIEKAGREGWKRVILILRKNLHGKMK